MLYDYNDNDENSILEYAKKLVGKKFYDVRTMYNESPYKCYEDAKLKVMKIAENDDGYYLNENAKGELGGFLEKYYFGYEPNSVQGADFEKVGIELKQTPLNLKKNGSYSAGERLSITNISYKNSVEEDFYQSHVWEKIKLILLVQYLRDKSIERMSYEIKFVNYFTPPKEDLEIIMEDYNKILQKLKDGKAHEISEGDTLYLGACTKGSTAEKSLQPQFYGDKILAKKRNFCLKRSYMDYILNEYILKNNVPYESLAKSNKILTQGSLSERVIATINQYKGFTDKKLCSIFNESYGESVEAQWAKLGYRMLGIKGNHALEFVKAGIVIKSIRVEESGRIRENMSFPNLNFKELANENWEDSTIRNYFSEKSFLFIVYKKVSDNYVLQGAQLWNMPISDLDESVYKDWTKIQNTIKKGISFSLKETKKGIIVLNDLLGEKKANILHLRPKSSLSAYKLKNGYTRRLERLSSLADELPNGEWMTKQCFWLNNDYIEKQIKPM